MAIYARCTVCRKDNTVSLRSCKGCGTKLGAKYLVRVKDNSTGKWRNKITPSLKLAKEEETKLKVLQIKGQLFDKKQQNRFSFEQYLNQAKLNKKSWKDDRKRWNRYIADKRHDKAKGIQQILNNLAHLSPQTRQHVLNLIRRVYNWHIEQSLWHDENPCRSIKITKFDNRVSNFLSSNQVSILTSYLDNWDNRRTALVILFALYTGRRKGEILNLTWSDISTDLRFITCRDTKNGSTMNFPLNAKAREVIRESQLL